MLCALCLSIFRERLSKFEWPHGLAHIRKASEAGCKICYHLMEAASVCDTDVQQFSASLCKRPEYSFYLVISVRTTRASFSTSEFFIIENESVQLPEGYSTFLRLVSLDLVGEPWHVRPDGFQKPIPKSTGDPAVTRIALEWLESCLSSHKACPPHQNPSTYPKRLIEVHSSTPRLAVAEDKPLHGYYATLSHCWGKDSTFFTLTQSGLETLKQGLPLNDLPQTFQDAITLTRHLNIPYLWIDSLCIVQDSNQDWLEHAQTMASIYENCVLNIAVDHAPNPFAGIFRERNTDRVQECHVLWAPPGKPEEETVWTVFDANNDVFYGQNLPLETRAWVFQERLLAPRVLHYGANAIFWECKTSPCSSEASPMVSGFWSPVNTLFSIVPDPPIQSTRARIAEYHCKLKERFQNLVEEYSALKLTKPDDDKLVAFAGIAKRLGSIDYYSHQYFAGFFMRGLPIDLVWINFGLEITKKIQDIYRAPTWSWASLDSSIAPFPWQDRDAMSDLVMLAEVRSISVSYVDPSNQYGQIKSAELALVGILIPCRIGTITMEDIGDSSFMGTNLEEEAEPSNIIGNFRPDMREGASHEGRKFACPIVESRWREGDAGGEIRGIVLQTTENGTFYERLGCFLSGFQGEGREVEELRHIISSTKKQEITIL